MFACRGQGDGNVGCQMHPDPAAVPRLREYLRHLCLCLCAGALSTAASRRARAANNALLLTLVSTDATQETWQQHEKMEREVDESHANKTKHTEQHGKNQRNRPAIRRSIAEETESELSAERKHIRQSMHKQHSQAPNDGRLGTMSIVMAHMQKLIQTHT